VTSGDRNWSFAPLGAVTGTGRKGDPYIATGQPASKGARITDKGRGVVYEATIEWPAQQASPRLTSLTIIPIDGQRIDQKLIRAVPVQRIAEQVGIYLARQEAGSLLISTGTYPTSQDTPSLQTVADLWHAGERRHDLARRFNVTPSAVDAWLGKCRKANLIPPATTGRPRRKEDKK
jgi:hypothetical protein